MDTLSLLRDHTIRKQLDSVVIAGNVCKFGDAYEFPVDIPTAYKARTGYGENGYYTLEMLVAYIKSSNLRHTEYMATVNRKQHVAFVDRKDLKVGLLCRWRFPACAYLTQRVLLPPPH